MATIVWALLGLVAICGTSTAYPVGVTSISEIHVSDSSSSSSEEVVSIVEAKLTVLSDLDEAAVEDTQDHTSKEEVKPVAKENEDEVTPDEGVENEGGESPVESGTLSSLQSTTESTEEVGEEEERNTGVSHS